jgi:hypothetical protein
MEPPGNTVVFKPKKADPKAQTEFYDAFKKAYFEKEKNKSLSAEEVSKLSLPAKIVTQLKNDPKYRLRMANNYGISIKVPQGDILTSTEYGYQTIQFKNNRTGAADMLIGGRWADSGLQNRSARSSVTIGVIDQHSPPFFTNPDSTFDSLGIYVVCSSGIELRWDRKFAALRLIHFQPSFDGITKF